MSFVDRHVAVLSARNRVPGPGQLRALVHEALVRCDPEVAAGREEAALADRDVTFDHRDSTATTRLSATLDTADALDLEATVTDLAGQLYRLGDTGSAGVRRARALGSLAHPQRTLELFGQTHGAFVVDPTLPTAAATAARPGETAVENTTAAVTHGGLGGPGPRGSSVVTLYLHVDAQDLADPTRGAGRVERLGAATLGRLHDWLSHAAAVTVRPVLDVHRSDAVDAHDPPGWMRESVVLRDRRCVFPGCQVAARSCDLDHVAPYVDPDDGGPPGQTRSANLACLCRRHHRLKTFSGWSYQALDGGPGPGAPERRYAWTSPHGHRYLAHPEPLR